MRISRYIAGFALAAVAVLGVAAPASAHDELISSSPAAGEQLAAAPATVDLVFSAELLDVGTLVLIVDSDEEDWAAGDAVVTGTDVSVPVTEGMPDGAYEARWRVVSSDGHPISGVIPFTIGDPAAVEETPSPSATAEPTATADPNATPDSSDQSGGDSGMLRIALIGGAGAIIALAVFAIITFLRRRKRDADDA